MDRIARADAAERRLVFEAAAVRLGTTPAVVEKDFWVCYALEHMFHRCPPLGGPHLQRGHEPVQGVPPHPALLGGRGPHTRLEGAGVRA